MIGWTFVRNELLHEYLEDGPGLVWDATASTKTNDEAQSRHPWPDQAIVSMPGRIR
jgi:hypothetical protein